jgi:DNA-binding NarL/FixJ family response regulator
MSSQDRQDSERAALERLSPREREILTLMVEGKSSRAMAALLHLSPKTVDTYRSRIMLKLDIANLPGLVKFAIRTGVTTL